MVWRWMGRTNNRLGCRCSRVDAGASSQQLRNRSRRVCAVRACEIVSGCERSVSVLARSRRGGVGGEEAKAWTLASSSPTAWCALYFACIRIRWLQVVVSHNSAQVSAVNSCLAVAMSDIRPGHLGAAG